MKRKNLIIHYLNLNICILHAGVFINIQYSLKCEVKRSFLIGTSMSRSLEFIVEYGSPNPNSNPSPSLGELCTKAEMKRVDFEMVLKFYKLFSVGY